MTTMAKAASILGRKGGASGTGAAKRRSSEHYRAGALTSASVRRALRKIRERIASLPDGHSYADGCGWFGLDGEPSYDGEIHVALGKASDGGLLLGAYQWARRGARDSDPMRYRPL